MVHDCFALDDGYSGGREQGYVDGMSRGSNGSFPDCQPLPAVSSDSLEIHRTGLTVKLVGDVGYLVGTIMTVTGGTDDGYANIRGTVTSVEKSSPQSTVYVVTTGVPVTDASESDLSEKFRTGEAAAVRFDGPSYRSTNILTTLAESDWYND